MRYLSNITRSEGDPKILHTGPSSLSAADRLARGLGWFSIGVGLTELFASGQITRALGLDGKEAMVKAFGAREIASGILSLSSEKRLGLWSRVLGDGLDIATLASASRPDNPKRNNVGLALAMVAGVTLLDVIGARAASVRHNRSRNGNGRSYHDRSGFPQGVRAARGAARNFKEPSAERHAPLLSHERSRSASQDSQSGLQRCRELKEPASRAGVGDGTAIS
jgi:hypothetical protein